MSGNTPAELIVRLRRTVTDTTAFCHKPVYRNPDGPEAADQLTVLTQRIGVLEEALQELHDDEHINFGVRNFARAAIERAALPPPPVTEGDRP